MDERKESAAFSAHPSTWEHVTSSMSGFEFPELAPCIEVKIKRQGEPEMPDLVVMPDGRAFYFQRPSIFGAVFHSVEGHCSNPHDWRTFLMRSRAEERPQVAVKMSRLAKMREIPQENVFREIAVMRHLSEGGGHPHVMSMVTACMSRTHLYVMTPFCETGDLLKCVVPGKGTGEDKARRWFRQIFLGLGYMNSKGLFHHDFSPENVVISGDGNAAVVMDFGMVHRLQTDDSGEVVPMRDPQPIGKPRYMAPEIWTGEEYDGRQIDIWSAGVTLLVCLVGENQWKLPTRTPMEHRDIYSSDINSYANLEQYGARVMLEREEYTSRMSEAAVDLLCQILVVDRGLRPRSAELLTQHPFFTAETAVPGSLTTPYGPL
ncbi:unnamed protein product [Scytosiphon promiscuus]